MVSAENYKQNRSVTVVGTLCGCSVSQPDKLVLALFTHHAITEKIS